MYKIGDSFIWVRKSSLKSRVSVITAIYENPNGTCYIDIKGDDSDYRFYMTHLEFKNGSPRISSDRDITICKTQDEVDKTIEAFLLCYTKNQYVYRILPTSFNVIKQKYYGIIDGHMVLDKGGARETHFESDKIIQNNIFHDLKECLLTRKRLILSLLRNNFDNEQWDYEEKEIIENMKTEYLI